LMLPSYHNIINYLFCMNNCSIKASEHLKVTKILPICFYFYTRSPDYMITLHVCWITQIMLLLNLNSYLVFLRKWQILFRNLLEMHIHPLSVPCLPGQHLPNLPTNSDLFEWTLALSTLKPPIFVSSIKS